MFIDTLSPVYTTYFLHAYMQIYPPPSFNAWEEYLWDYLMIKIADSVTSVSFFLSEVEDFK